MKFLLPVAVLLSSIVIVNAQSPTPQRKPVVIQLTPRFSPAHTFNHPVKGIQVFLANGDTSRLGFAQTGILNSLRDALPDKPMQQYLEEYVSKAYSNQYKPNGNTLLLVIKYFRIGERSGVAAEKAFVRVKADAFGSADNISWQFTAAIDTVLEQNGLDVTKNHNLNIEEALDLLIATADNGMLRATKYTFDEVKKKELHLYDAPAYTAASFKQGVYMSYNEFIMNEPSITLFRPSINNGTAIIYAIHDDGTETVINNPWGMCFKDQLFKYHKRFYIPFIREGRAFLFNMYYGLSERNNAITTNGAKYGMMAPFITDPALKKDPMSVSVFPYIRGLLPDATTIDPFSGELMF
ncbi:hypothetical protein [Chitinophaga sancti]|uniref:hypothetical protein n=1 Tax=Chitinophaga sancti TaxID=1004 RepID=UPI003F7900B9